MDDVLAAAQKARANTFSDSDYDRRALLMRVDRGGAAVCCRTRSIEVALAMARRGELVCEWDGPNLIARSPAPRLRPSGPGMGAA